MAKDTQTEPKSATQKPKRLQNVLKNVTKDLYKRNYELAQTNRTLSLLRSIDNIALGSHETLNIFCTKLAEAIVKTVEFPLAGIIASSINQRRLDTYSGFSASKELTVDQLEAFNNIAVDKDMAWYRSERKAEILKADKLFQVGLTFLPRVHGYADKTMKVIDENLGIESVVLVKLSSSQKIVGIMIIGFQQSVTNISPNDLDLLNRLADSIGLALESKLLFDENKRVAEQLRKANDKLKALDEAKDDFISMASHQLRTPLTSIKGYLSMVLDGDVGKVSETQKDMLGQAFFSSQRMVYLIADLLNVSRLKTGKFVIDPSPVNLAEIVDQELSQLSKTAASKSLKLTYDKPKSFPTLMLDETKTRQVIMNFVDNAVYYTPAGGAINVRLVDSPSTVELRVEDNGIGVPKAEQHHLFTKFYRAGNARKARPDGTGLGLFMAKKVIVAEGGSIIFETEENKGSTFGFIFSKSKLARKAGNAALAKKEPAKELATV